MDKRLAGALCVIALACTPPPRVPPRPPDPPQIFTTECDGLRMQLTVARQPRSAPTYELYITDASGQPLAEDARVVLAFTPAGPYVSTTTVVARRTGAGRYGPANGFVLSPGAWQVEVIARQAGGTEAVCLFVFGV